ncbi:MAG: type IV pilin protein [Gammaproteobacteria bacterium]
MSSRQEKGFTIIELLIAVAILGVLSAIAIPSYLDNVGRSRRSEAKTVLLEVASEQERFFSSNNSYTTNDFPLTGVADGRESESGYYAVSVAACAGGAIANCFVATATAQNEQAGETCTTLTLSSTGIRGATGGSADDCWMR